MTIAIRKLSNNDDWGNQFGLYDYRWFLILKFLITLFFIYLHCDKTKNRNHNKAIYFCTNRLRKSYI